MNDPVFSKNIRREHFSLSPLLKKEWKELKQPDERTDQ